MFGRLLCLTLGVHHESLSPSPQVDKTWSSPKPTACYCATAVCCRRERVCLWHLPPAFNPLFLVGIFPHALYLCYIVLHLLAALPRASRRQQHIVTNTRKSQHTVMVRKKNACGVKPYTMPPLPVCVLAKLKASIVRVCTVSFQHASTPSCSFTGSQTEAGQSELTITHQTSHITHHHIVPCI